jgi:hypothetical protein
VSVCAQERGRGGKKTGSGAGERARVFCVLCFVYVCLSVSVSECVRVGERWWGRWARKCL